MDFKVNLLRLKKPANNCSIISYHFSLFEKVIFGMM